MALTNSFKKLKVECFVSLFLVKLFHMRLSLSLNEGVLGMWLSGRGPWGRVAIKLRAWKSCRIKSDFSCSRFVIKLLFLPTSTVNSLFCCLSLSIWRSIRESWGGVALGGVAWPTAKLMWEGNPPGRPVSVRRWTLWFNSLMLWSSKLSLSCTASGCVLGLPGSGPNLSLSWTAFKRFVYQSKAFLMADKPSSNTLFSSSHCFNLFIWNMNNCHFLVSFKMSQHRLSIYYKICLVGLG